MKSLLLDNNVSNVHIKTLGQRVAGTEQVGFCCDGRMLTVQKDRKGNIIGLELI